MKYSSETLTLRDGRTCVIRSAEPDDAPLVLSYMKTVLAETPFLLRTPEEFDYTPEEEAGILSARKEDPRGVILVAEADGQIAAVADIRSRGGKSRVYHRGELGISVKKAFWRVGLGSALIGRLLAIAQKNGFEQIELTVAARNSRARALYERFGFTVCGECPHGMKYPDGTYDNDVLMVNMFSDRKENDETVL